MIPQNVVIHMDKVIQTLKACDLAVLIDRLDDHEFVIECIRSRFKTGDKLPLDLDWLHAQYVHFDHEC